MKLGYKCVPLSIALKEGIEQKEGKMAAQPEQPGGEGEV
jgi:hypothetical protein